MQSISKIIASDNWMTDYWRNAKYLEVLVV